MFQVTVQVSNGMFFNDLDGFQCTHQVFQVTVQVFQVTVQVSNGMFLNDLGGLQVYFSSVSGVRSGVSGDRSGVQWYVFA